MKRHLKSLALSLALVLMLGEAAMAQVQFRVPLYLAWGTKRDTIYVGVNGGNGGSIQPGTYGLDLVTTNNFGPLGLYGESGSPPPDADGNRVRFIDVNGRTQIGAAGGFFKYDFRGFSSSAQADTFAIEVTGLVVEGNDLTVGWPAAATLGQNGTYWAIHTRSASAPSAGAQLANMLATASYTFAASGNPARFTVVKVGALVPSPGPTFSASPVNFGTVAVGASATANLVVTNTGSSNSMSISAISAAVAPFSYTVPAVPVILTAGQSLTIPVTFAPTVAGPASGSVVFTHDAPGNPSTVVLSGTAASNANKLFFSADSVVKLDKTSGYRDTLYVNITDTMKAIQFQIESKGLTLLRSISKGAGLLAAPFTSSSWNFNAQFYRGAANTDGSSNDSIIVVAYGNGSTVLLPGTYPLAAFQYDVVNIDQPDTQWTSFELDKLVASNPLGTSLGLALDAPQVVKVTNRTTFADVNDDGYVDILDLLLIVDHILQRSLLTGAAFERADVVNPFPGGDGLVNALDLAAVQNIILTGRYPDNTTINKMPVAIAQMSGTDEGQSLKKTTATSRVTFHITASGLAVRVESDRRVKGIQFDLATIASIAAGTEVKSVMGSGYYDLTSDNRLRVLVYDEQGASMDAGQYILAHMDFTIANASVVKAENVILADEKNLAIEGVEVVISRDAADELPIEYSLKQNYPNPFNPTTDIQFSVPVNGDVKISIFNVLGQEVRTLFAGEVARGTRVVRWDGQSNSGFQLPSGTYIYRMVAGSFVESRKMMLLK
jgi:hypothetical protein